MTRRAMLDGLPPLEAVDWQRRCKFVVAMLCAERGTMWSTEVRYYAGDGPTESSVDLVLAECEAEGWIVPTGRVGCWRAAS